MLAEGLHGLQTFFVFLDLAFGPADGSLSPKGEKGTDGADIPTCSLDLHERPSYTRARL